MAEVYCPHHDRLQRDVNGLTELVQELREWRAAQEERQRNLEEKIEQAITWMKWAVGLSLTSVMPPLERLSARFWEVD